jgi:hypothetical protein
MEAAMKAILKFARSSNLSPKEHSTASLVQAGSLYMKVLEAMRKEFKPLRDLWRALFDHTSVLDEIDMCTTRLELGSQEEFQYERSSNRGWKTTLPRPPNVVFEHELDEKREEFKVSFSTFSRFSHMYFVVTFVRGKKKRLLQQDHMGCLYSTQERKLHI